MAEREEPGQDKRPRAAPESASGGLPDVSDRKQLEAWLRSQPPEVSVVLAARAALRVLPAVGLALDQEWPAPERIAADMVLPVFRATALPWAAAKFPAHGRELAAAFAHVHADMEKAHGEAQISFGGRFAEKAIQLSFILPEATEEERNDYLVAVLTGGLPIAGTGDGTAAGGTGVGTGAGEPAAAQDELSRELAEFERRARQRFAATHDTEELAQAKRDFGAEIDQRFSGTGDGTSDELARRFRQAARRRVDVEAIYHSSTSRQTEEDIGHAIQPLAPLLPGNPRRIKRIVNMIGAFEESGQLIENIDPLSREWRQLALWTVVMSEYPQVWRMLVTDEDTARELVALAGVADGDGKVTMPSLGKGAGDAEKARHAMVAGFASDRRLVRLLRGDPFNEAEPDDAPHALDDGKDGALKWLRRLTPLA